MIVRARPAAGKPTHIPLDDPPRRIAHPQRHVPRATVSDDSDDTSEIEQHRLGVGRIAQVERHAGKNHAIKEALEHGGQAETPGRKLQYENLGRGEPRDIVLQSGAIARLVVIVPTGLFGKDGIKLLGVEIEKIDLMARLGQR